MSQNVIVYNLLIVTWDAVGYYPSSVDKVGLYICIVVYILWMPKTPACMYLCDSKARILHIICDHVCSFHILRNTYLKY